MQPVILPTAYHPSILYFVILNSAKESFIETHEHYYKQTYRNRCHIISPNGKIDLSIPVNKGIKHKTPVCDITIDYEANWIHNHIKAIETSYYPAPFFEIIYPDILQILNTKPKYLVDLNRKLLNYYLDMLNISSNLYYTKGFLENENHQFLDFRKLLHPKKNYQQHYSFLDTPYYQVFQGKLDFIPELSILDLLFHLGSEAGLYIRKLSAIYKQLA
ncbi:MAG: WbqC family protein [Bacteroidales bacterium]|nr:WbqC family protein [Bacteroidales bacterium]